MMAAALASPPDFAMPPKKAARFPRTARLLRHADFERVYKLGRRHFSASMTVFYWPRPDSQNNAETELEETKPKPKKMAAPSAPQGLRVGFTVGRVLGGAVQRNRMKRRLREAVRMSRPLGAIAVDVVINPKKSLLTVDFSLVLNEVSRAFAVIEQKLSQPACEKTPAPTPMTTNNRSAGSPKPKTGRRNPEPGSRS
jgi:ribonuclease P protein component